MLCVVLTVMTTYLQVVFDKKCLMRTLPYTDIPHSVQYLYGGPQPASGLQKRYNKVVFKVSLQNVIFELHCVLGMICGMMVRVSHS